jgi:predicted RND superfamily exporter protein
MGGDGGGGFERYVDWVCRHARAVIVALLAVTIFWASHLPLLRVEIDPDANLPQDHPYIQALHTLESTFGEKNLIVVGLFPKDGDVFSARFLAKLQRITRRIEQVPGLIRSTYLGLAAPLAKAIEGEGDTLLVRPIIEGAPVSAAAVAEVRRRAFVNPLYVGSVVAADGSATAIVANFRLTEQLSDYPQIADHIESILVEENDGTFTTHLGGPVAVLAALADVAERTGGTAYEAPTSEALADAYDQIADSLGETMGEEIETITELTWRWALGAFVILATAWALSLWWLRGMV